MRRTSLGGEPDEDLVFFLRKNTRTKGLGKDGKGKGAWGRVVMVLGGLLLLLAGGSY